MIKPKELKKASIAGTYTADGGGNAALAELYKMNTAKYGNQDNMDMPNTTVSAYKPIKIAEPMNTAVSSPEASLAELAYQQKRQKEFELERAKKTTLSNLAAEGKATNEQYRQRINDTSTQADIALKNYFENVANRGQTNSGSTAQGELAQNIAKQNNISGLQTARAGAMSDIERRKTLAEQGYLDDVQSFNNSVDLNTMQNTIDLQRQNQANEINTVGQYGEDFQAEINRRMAVNPNDPLIPYLKMARQQKVAGIAESEAQAQQAQMKAQQEQEAANLNQAKFMATLGDFTGLKQLGYDTTQLEKEWNANLSNTYSQIADRNDSGNGGTNGTVSKKTITKFDGNVKAINDMYGDGTIISYGNGNYGIRPDARAAYLDPIVARTIDNTNLTDDEKIAFLTSLGITEEEYTRVADYYVK